MLPTPLPLYMKEIPPAKHEFFWCRCQGKKSPELYFTWNKATRITNARYKKPPTLPVKNASSMKYHLYIIHDKNFYKITCMIVLQVTKGASFGSRNRPLEWNDFSIRIIILLFGMCLFLKIVIPMGITIPFQREIRISLKNEKHSYFNGNRLHFLEKTTLIFYLFLKKE